MEELCEIMARRTGCVSRITIAGPEPGKGVTLDWVLSLDARDGIQLSAIRTIELRCLFQHRMMTVWKLLQRLLAPSNQQVDTSPQANS